MSLHFEPINFELQEKYLERLAACPVKTSDYSFVNLWGWAEEYGLKWAWTDELVWIKQTTPKNVYWPPVGNWEKVEDWNGAMDGLVAEKACFIRIPEFLSDIWKDGIQEERLSVREDRGQWDYLYSAEDLVELKGNRFHKKKNLLNQFMKKYDYRYICFGKEMTDQVLGMQWAWCQWRDCELDDALAAENRAIEKVFNAWDKIKNICGGALVVDDQVVAYTLAEYLAEDTLLIHFEKGNPSYQGTYQAINRMFVARALEDASRRIKVVNRMQDLGDEGLRKAKLSYNPVDFIEKFEVDLL